MSEKGYRADEENELGPLARSIGSPGKMPASAKLFPGAMLMRKARDGNGVEAGAEDAVAAASSASGSALPSDVRGRFEGTLGADLSDVRVHTGGESATAASSVGARAYTVGNDIHFAAGQYAPTDPFGLHLLAHEVAHTQQQAGGSPVRQNKLEVSSPGDMAEVEADRAADAMVTGAAFDLGGGGAHVGRKVMRDYADMNSQGDDAAQNKQYDLSQQPSKPGDTTTYLGASNVEDRSQAIAMINSIAPNAAAIAMSGRTERLAQNKAAEAALRDYTRASGDQNFAQSLFEPEFDRVKIQFARLEAMFQAHFAKGGMPQGGDGVALANAAATAGTSTGADSASDLKRSMQGQSASNDVVTNNQMQTQKASIQALQREMGAYGPAIGATSDAVINSNKALKNAVAVQSGPQPKLDESEDEKTARIAAEGVKNDLESAVQTVGAIGSLAKKVAGAVPGGEEATQVVETAKESFETGMKFGNAAARQPGAEVPKVELTEMAVKYFTDFDAKMAAANGQLKNAKDTSAAQWARSLLSDVQQKGGALKAAWSAYQRNMEAFDKLQVSLRSETDKLVHLMPKPGPGQPDLGAALSLQNEATAFTAQADGALEIAKRERAEAKTAKDAKATAAGGSEYAAPDPSKYFGQMVQEKVGLTYWECRRIPGVDEGYEAYQWGEHQVTFTKTPQNESNTQESVDGKMDKAIAQIETMKKNASTFAQRMAELTGVGAGRY